MIEPSGIRPIEELLHKIGIRFMLEDGDNPCLGAPEAAMIEFGRDADLEKIQRVLDSRETTPRPPVDQSSTRSFSFSSRHGAYYGR